MLLAQLVDMGFSLEASRVAIAASGSTDLQKVLDILVQNEQAEEAIPASAKSPPSTNRTNLSSDDDEQDDPRVEREQEELWKKQQEERRKEYLDQLKRNKPTPPIPNQRPAYSTSSTNSSTFSSSSYQPSSVPSSNVSTPPAPPQTDPITVYADKERKQGNFFFNKGQYSEAEHAYSLSIGSLPAGHGDLVLLCNNRAAARLKQGKYQDCLADCSLAIDLARKNMNSNAPMTTLMRGASTNMKAQLIKALHRKASALEGLCLFEAAIQVYEEYVRLDGSRSAQVTQGIIRCQQALLDSKKKQQQQQQQQSWKPATSTDDNTTAFPDIDFNMFIPKPASQFSQAQLDEINKSKAVKEMRDREKQKEAEEAERLGKEDKVNAQISVWKTGKDKNLRALLGSLELILWPGVQWKGVMMSELLEPKKCKITYMKAIAKVHPDKVRYKQEYLDDMLTLFVK
jgi:tetratricopeptide (TPR) repeat protein